ncbi:MAG TPA: hypothetical protein VF460_05535 [Burkholderiales bacterium]
MNGLRTAGAWLVLACFAVATTAAADLPSAAPESVGFSSERLARIGPVIKGEIEKGQ